MSIVTQSIGQYQSWTPTLTGFTSATPTVTSARYSLNGKMCHVQFAMAASASNATTFTITLPFTSKILNIIVGGQAVDNSAAVTTALRADLTAASNVATLYKSNGATVWTGSGNKGARFEFTYEIE
jgi:hypothetical protein